MEEEVQIEVTEEDIAIGEQGSVTSCPIAHAVRRKMGRGVKVGPAFVTFRRTRRYLLPPEAQKFVYNFDISQPVAPISFTMKRV